MPPRSILLDATALALFAEDAKSIAPWFVYARKVNADLYVSAVTLAETSDATTRDVNLRRTLKACLTIPVSDEIAFSAGALRARAVGSRRKPRDLTVDALVAATALLLPSPTVVFTGDPSDMVLLLEGTLVAVERIN